MKFPFVFKSSNSGIFSEQWEFHTHPVVCGGATLLVTLRAVALKQDKFEKQREDVEVSFLKKSALGKLRKPMHVVRMLKVLQRKLKQGKVGIF